MKRKKIKIPDRPERLLIISFIVCFLITVFVAPVSAPCVGCDGSPTEPACCHASPSSTGKTSTASGGVGDATSGSNTHVGTLTPGGTFDSGNGFTFVIGGNEKTLITCNQLDSYKVENIQATERAWPDSGADGQTYIDPTFDPLAGYGVNDPPGQDLATDFDVVLTYKDDPILESPFTDSGRADDTGGETFTVDLGNVNDPPVLDLPPGGSGSEFSPETFSITVPDSGDENTGETTGDGVTLTVEDSTGDTTPVVNENALDMLYSYTLDDPGSLPLTISAPDPGDGSTGTETFTVDLGNVNDPPVLDLTGGSGSEVSPDNTFMFEFSEPNVGKADADLFTVNVGNVNDPPVQDLPTGDSGTYSGTPESSIVQWSETSGTDYWTSLWSSANEQNTGERVVESDGVEISLSGDASPHNDIIISSRSEVTDETKTDDAIGWSPSETTTYDDSATSLYEDYYNSVFGDTLSSGEKNKDSEISGSEKTTTTYDKDGNEVATETKTGVDGSSKVNEGEDESSTVDSSDEKSEPVYDDFYGAQIGTRTTTTTYDKDGNKVITETLNYDIGDSEISKTTYAPSGQVLSSEDVNSKAIIGPDGSKIGTRTTSTTYKDGNKVVTVTLNSDSGTEKTTTTSDSAGRQIEIQNKYDPEGNLLYSDKVVYDTENGKVDITRVFDSTKINSVEIIQESETENKQVTVTKTDVNGNKITTTETYSPDKTLLETTETKIGLDGKSVDKKTTYLDSGRYKLTEEIKSDSEGNKEEVIQTEETANQKTVTKTEYDSEGNKVGSTETKEGNYFGGAVTRVTKYDADGNKIGVDVTITDNEGTVIGKTSTDSAGDNGDESKDSGKPDYNEISWSNGEYSDSLSGQTDTKTQLDDPTNVVTEYKTNDRGAKVSIETKTSTEGTTEITSKKLGVNSGENEVVTSAIINPDGSMVVSRSETTWEQQSLFEKAVYDSKGNLVELTTINEPDRSRVINSDSDVDDKVNVYKYDEKGLVLEHTEIITYDSGAWKQTVVEHNGNTDNPVSATITDSSGEKTVRIRTQDSTGRDIITEKTYDAKGNLISKSSEKVTQSNRWLQ